jgi:RimJ/RimL family protein N-acetyltransferase
MPSSIPTLETGRLRLRGYRLDDFPACAALWADPYVTRFIGGRPLSAEESWARLLRYAGHWWLLGFGYWVVEEKDTGAFVGELGFAQWRRELEPVIEVPEAGWVLATWAHGKGYATEGLQAALAWAGRHFAKPQTVCLIHPDNLASIRVAVKCGYRESARVTYRGQLTILFER